MTVAYILMAVVGAACAIFALQNMARVDLYFLGWQARSIPLALVILLSLLGGVLLASCVGLLRRWKLRSRIRQLEAQLAGGQRSGGASSPPARNAE